MEDREYLRLKELIDSGRKFHYRNFVFSGLVYGLLLKDTEDKLSIFFEIEYPIKLLILFLLVVIVVYTAITIDILTGVWKKTQENFVNEIPFNWFVLSPGTSKALAYFWIALPLFFCIIAIGISDFSNITFYVVLFSGIALRYPFYIKEFFNKITYKRDESGNRITLSIFCLFCYRFLRSTIVMIIFAMAISFIFTYGPLPEIDGAADYAKGENPKLVAFFGGWFFLEVLRSIWGIKWIYRRVDSYGTKFGFAKEYIKFR